MTTALYPIGVTASNNSFPRLVDGDVVVRPDNLVPPTASPYSSAFPLPEPGPVESPEKILKRKQDLEEATQSSLAASLEEYLDKPYVDFPLHVLPEVVQDYVNNGPEKINSGFVILPLLSLMSAMIGNSRKLWVERSHYEPANLWTATVGDSGSGKSPGQGYALAAVKPLTLKARAEYQRAVGEYQKKLETYKLAVKEAKANGQPAPEGAPEQPEKLRYVTSDTTMEALADVLSKGGRRGIIRAVDELKGVFSGLNQYKSGKGDDKQKLLSLWSGEELSIDRKSSEEGEVYVPHPFMALTGNIQPEMLAQVLTDDSYSDGTAARFLFAMPPGRQPGISRAKYDPGAGPRMTQFLELLANLRGDPGEYGEVPHVITLQDDAKDLLDQWTRDNHAFTNSHDKTVQKACVKLDSYAERLALLLHVLRTVGATTAAGMPDYRPAGVDRQTMADALVITDWFKTEMLRTYARLQLEKVDRTGELESLKHTRIKREILTMAKTTGRVDSRSLIRKYHRSLKTVGNVHNILEELGREGEGTITREVHPINGKTLTVFTVDNGVTRTTI